MEFSTFADWFRPSPSFAVRRQHDSTDCGPACLAMVADHYGAKMTLSRMRERCSLDRQGSSLYNLSEAAEELGMRTLGARLDLDRLRAEAPLPCIVHWEQNHFVVVYAIDDDRVYVADPATGTLSYTTQAFLDGWTSGVTDDGTPIGAALLLEPTPDFEQLEKGRERSGPELLWNYLRRYRSALIQLGVGVIAASGLQLIFPFLTQALVDVGIENQDLGFVYVVLLAQLMLVFSRTAVQFIENWIVLHVGARIDISMISDFLLKLMQLPAAFYDARHTGDLLQRIDDHRRVREFLTGTLLQALTALFTLLSFGAVLAIYSGTIFLLFLGGSAIYVVYIVAFLDHRRELDYKRFDQESENQNLLIETIRGMQEIKLNNAQRQRRWTWERLQARLYDVSIESLSLDQYQRGGATFINEIKDVIITIVAARMVISGEITLGVLLAIQYILGQLNAPLNQMVTFLRSGQDAKLSLDRLADMHGSVNEGDNKQHKVRVFPESPDIVIENVGFSYAGTRKERVLKDFSLTIPYGTVTAVVGESGSGKTTLMKLLLKIYSPTDGRICLGSSLNLNHVSDEEWRKRCGVVMQDGQLFSDTIARNIALGDESIDRERLYEATRLACIQDVVESLPLGYETTVGRDGVGLSRGQKQRLLIARAVYRDPEYLFFDEATSSLDTQTERAIVENMEEFYANRTVFVVAHRLSTVRNADKIVVLDDGQMVEIGSHDDLVHQKGAYYHLVKNQLELGA